MKEFVINNKRKNYKMDNWAKQEDINDKSCIVIFEKHRYYCDNQTRYND